MVQSPRLREPDGHYAKARPCHGGGMSVRTAEYCAKHEPHEPRVTDA